MFAARTWALTVMGMLASAGLALAEPPEGADAIVLVGGDGQPETVTTADFGDEPRSLVFYGGGGLFLVQPYFETNPAFYVGGLTGRLEEFDFDLRYLQQQPIPLFLKRRLPIVHDRPHSFSESALSSSEPLRPA